MSAYRNVWQQQDPMPSPCEPCKTSGEETEYALALTDPSRCFGRAIKEDPLVVWIDRTHFLDRDVVWGHNNFAKSIAKMLGLTHAWVILAAGNAQYAPDAEGRKTVPRRERNSGTKDPGLAPDRFVMEETDLHMDLRLGTGLYDCRLSAHAYVMLDRQGSPERYMTKRARRFRREGGDHQLSFWKWQNYRKRLRPRRRVCTEKNWEEHANVGPYRETHRPDYYGPRKIYTLPESAMPREFMENDDNIFEGAMTDELRALVRKCHAAYDAYRTLHERLAPMQNPDLESLRELHVLREHIITMKREIYREAMGLIL